MTSLTCQAIINKNYLPRKEAELLLASLLTKTRAEIIAHPETALAPKMVKKFEALARKRREGWPLAYLLGRQGFYGRDYLVTPAVLIPRPETEILVDEMLAECARLSDQDLTIVDVGTGSGAIIGTLAAELGRRPTPPEIQLWATDISASALKIARKNIAALGLARQVEFARGNLLAPFYARLQSNRSRLLIAANLPYLTPALLKASPSIQHEPRLALAGGADGLELYRRLFRQLKSRRLSFSEAQIYCEIVPAQKQALIRIAAEILGPTSCRTVKDLAGKDRLVIIGASRPQNY